MLWALNLKAMPLDLSIFRAIHNLSGQSKFLDWVGIFLADYLGYFLILASLILLFSLQKRFYFFSLAALSLLLSWGLIVEIIRVIYYRPRPFLDLGFTALIDHSATGSFPSGHAAFFFTLAFAVFYFNRRWGFWFLVAAVLMGLARIFAGVHWPTDIVAGAAIGLLSVVAVRYLLPYKRFEQSEFHPNDPN